MNNLLNDLAASVSSAENLEGLTRPLLELLEAVTTLESTYLTTVDLTSGTQHILYARNSRQMVIPEGLSVPWGDTLCKRALDENRPYTDDVPGIWGDSNAARQLGIQTYLSQPVRNLDGGLFGTLCGASAEKVVITDATIRVLDMFARLIAHQVESERTVRTLRQTNAELSSRAMTDPLTGSMNRYALNLALDEMLANAARDGGSVSVAFIDLDEFKPMNDTHGHDFGDRFLIFMAAKLLEGIRPQDQLARYGGDEFVVLAPDADPKLAERLFSLTQFRYSHDDITIDYAGASVGVAISESGECDREALLSRADAAMYAEKTRRRAATGHNR